VSFRAALRLGLGLAALALLSTLGASRTSALKPAPLPPLPVIAAPVAPPTAPARWKCPPEMVDVAGRFCVDRWEASLVEPKSGRFFSPYYHPDREIAARDHRYWEKIKLTLGDHASRQAPLPELPSWQLDDSSDFEARSVPDRTPNAYLDYMSAQHACRSAAKRLCTRNEWLMACRSQRATRHPYGEWLEPGSCNVSSAVHPATILHGKDGGGHGTDPRLNLVEFLDVPLLRTTGSLPGCKSAWEDDAVYDMVGNLDEWIDDDSGVFVGGFYARITPWGCDERVTIHAPDYYDYSLGTRCCL
jgi:formylglycine-generating enzyme